MSDCRKWTSIGSKLVTAIFFLTWGFLTLYSLINGSYEPTFLFNIPFLEYNPLAPFSPECIFGNLIYVLLLLTAFFFWVSPGKTKTILMNLIFCILVLLVLITIVGLMIKEELNRVPINR